ncbi:cobalt ECF transporter T component CbiQ [Paenibacillus harenae]|uniref:Cobalt ECF transporter T component CbiQ n=1 Tax=Paenibacillus harenae TaxID=306543 RepID=A0ABT9UAC7_PAEHA|nr:cobalt ECF transporter T component CbiQ [Paenibacillus harenae]MDQ0115973.1 cobalt ECF transporter T component CbiQ [Paenibacillus harenae]
MHSHMEMEKGGSRAGQPALRQAKRRLLTVIGLLVVVVLFKHPAALFGAAGCFLFGLLWAGVSLRTILKRLLLIVPFGLGAVVFIPFQSEGTPIFTIFGLTASAEGVSQAEIILLKIVCANLLITYMGATTPQFLLIKSLRAVGIPAVLIEIISLMLRYFYLLKAEAQSMVKAQRSRGLVLDGWLWSRRTYKRFGELLGVLFLRSQGRSERIYNSIMARGGFAGHSPEPGGENGVDEHHARERGSLGMLERGDKEAAIEVLGVSYRYGATQALHNVSFRIGQGEKVALMGPNGAGKSTLISLLNGLEQPSEGEVRLLGESLAEVGAKRLRSRIGVVFQDPDDQIFSTSVEEDVAFGPGNMGLNEEQTRQRVEKALSAVNMLEYRGRSPFELSYGQKRRVAIAGVLAMEPDIIVLDEPMAFLDPKSRDGLQELLESMHETGITLIVATHDVDFAAEWAGRVLLLKDGGLLAEGTTDLLFDDSLLSKADLHLPRLARPFRMLQATGGVKPKTVLEAAQQIWKLMTKGEQQASSCLSGEDKTALQQDLRK